MAEQSWVSRSSSGWGWRGSFPHLVQTLQCSLSHRPRALFASVFEEQPSLQTADQTLRAQAGVGQEQVWILPPLPGSDQLPSPCDKHLSIEKRPKVSAF